ncbi:hypothetical protein hmeg3_05505 [Herbaspirillum sp. meg3]|uniref:hypothetical protein n=1 Tax=Herbaspirillum sp. meg3 TaxID=2025949 RepID=UPI000B98A4AE|nr:hypothetical protein [Herbaspirillum sp. meg3]ASU37805.1 hypothetical protein hmeg3_05505 [Herbaspirillum sp. meg3]
MKNSLKTLFLLTVTASTLVTAAAHADEPGRHPFYAHARADLDQARWLIDHRPGDNWQMGRSEQVALREIDLAARDVTQLGIDVGKDMFRPERADVHPDRRGRLHDAVATLEKAHQDLAHEEDDPRVRGLQRDALRHVDIALHATQDAIREAGY